MDTLEEFFQHIICLASESDRRLEVAGIKASKYMISRIKCAKNSVALIDTCSEQSPETSKKLKEINIELSAMLKAWEDKKQSLCHNNDNNSNFERYSCQKVYTGKVGRPFFNIETDCVLTLREYHFTWEQIAKIFSVSRTTLWRHLKKNDVDSGSFSSISQVDLNNKVKEIKNSHHLAGERMIVGFLRAENINVQRWRVRQSIHTVDPVNCVSRWLRKNSRCVYSVPGPNSLWHNDGLHKLIRWGFVVHACIDGYSRMITYLLAATNNYATTALEGFLDGIKKFGIPARVRGDKGGENVKIMDFMRRNQGYIGAYIQGPSVHNQRIERLHYDTTHCVLRLFIDVFDFMEKENLLDVTKTVDMFALHFIFLPRIQNSLDSFQEAWNQHQISTEKSKTPYQLWMMGMMDHNKSGQRGVQRYVDDECDYFGIDPSPSMGIMPDDCSIVELHDVTISGKNSDQVKQVLSSEFQPIDDDGNFGIDLFCKVKDRLCELL